MFKLFLMFIRCIEYRKFIAQFLAKKFNEKMKMIIFLKFFLKEVMLKTENWKLRYLHYNSIYPEHLIYIGRIIWVY
jgi:hypothetical protein